MRLETTIKKDEDGIATVIGAILILSVLVLAWTTAQSTYVPQQEQEEEYEHNEEVQQKMTEVWGNIQETSRTGSQNIQTMRLGAEYPNFMVFIPGTPPSGVFATSGSDKVIVENAEATDEDIQKFIDGTDLTYETKSISYQPIYNHYDNAPATEYENTILYNDYPDGKEEILTKQQLINGKTINLVLLNGSISTSRKSSISIITSPVSAPSKKVRVRDTSDNIKIRIPTKIGDSESERVQIWRDILSDELSNGHVSDVSIGSNSNQIVIELERGTEYFLRVPRVGVRLGEQATLDKSKAKYIIRKSAKRPSVYEGSQINLDVQVLSENNAPVEDFMVEARIVGGYGEIRPGAGNKRAELNTSTDGTATIRFIAPDDIDGSNKRVDVRVWIKNRNEIYEEVAFDVQIVNQDGSGQGKGN